MLTSWSAMSQQVADPDTLKVINDLNDKAYQLVKSNPAASLDYSSQALLMSQRHSHAEGQINALLLTGMVYKNIGEFDRAAESYFNALRIAETSDNQVKVSSCLNNIGNIYQAQNNFQKALYYYKRSLDIEEKLKNKPQISIRLYNIGALYETVDSLDRALSYYYSSLLIEEETGNREGVLYALYGISGVETRLGRYASASDNIEKALRIASEMNDTSGLALCYHEYGLLQMARGSYSEAAVLLDSAAFYARQMQMRNDLMQIYKDQANAFAALNRPGDAYRTLLKHLGLKDTISSIEMTGKVAELEARFQVEKKEEEIRYLQTLRNAEMRNAASEKRNRNFLLIAILMIVILSVFNLQRISPDTKTLLRYSLFTMASLLLIALLLSLLTGNLSFDGFIVVLRDVITYAMPVLFVAVFFAERILLKRYLAQAREYTRELQELKPEVDKRSIQFRFEGKEADISIQQESLLCIEANDNYIALYHLVSGRVKKELYRSTMKLAEEQLKGMENLVRCHKSYIINTLHVSRVSGNAQGYKIHLENIEFEIPVSRSFPREMISSLRKSASHQAES